MSNRVVAGIGCRRNCPAEDILTVVRHACARAGISANGLAAAEFKAGEPGLHAAAQHLGLPLLLVDGTALSAAQERCVTRSGHAAQAVGVASVAEGCALAAAGIGSRLLLPRVAFGGATCALAEAAAT
jgi:cobalt-precorrin 5A hydrolase